MAAGKVIDVGKKGKKLQPIRTKFKTYRTTEWMNNMRLVNVFLALTDMNMAVPTSYDMVIAGCWVSRIRPLAAGLVLP